MQMRAIPTLTTDGGMAVLSSYWCERLVMSRASLMTTHLHAIDCSLCQCVESNVVPLHRWLFIEETVFMQTVYWWWWLNSQQPKENSQKPNTKPKPANVLKYTRKNCSSLMCVCVCVLCAYHCAQLWYTIQIRTYIVYRRGWLLVLVLNFECLMYEHQHDACLYMKLFRRSVCLQLMSIVRSWLNCLMQ